MSRNSTAFSQPTSVGSGNSEVLPQMSFVSDDPNPPLDDPESEPAPLVGPGISRLTNSDSNGADGSKGSIGSAGDEGGLDELLHELALVSWTFHIWACKPVPYNGLDFIIERANDVQSLSRDKADCSKDDNSAV